MHTGPFVLSALSIACISSLAHAQNIKKISTVSAPYVAPTPLTPAEIEYRENTNDPKRNGQIVLSRIDRTIKISDDPRTPNFYFYRQTAVGLNLRPTQLMIRTDRKWSDAQVLAACKAAGVEAVSIERLGAEDFDIVHLRAPLADASATHAALVRLGQRAEITSASPCFGAPFDGARWFTPSGRIMLRFKPEQATNALAMIKRYAPGAIILTDHLGGVANAYTIALDVRNGYDVIRLANTLASDPAVEWAAPDWLQQISLHTIPNDTFFGNQWHLRDTSSSSFDIVAWRAWNYTTGTGVRVLVTDDGAETNHADLNWGGGRNFVTSVAAGDGDGSPDSCGFHGQACAGLISARFNNNLGVAGVAPDSTTWNARIASTRRTDGTCANPSFTVFTNTYLLNAVNWGRNNGCRISSASIGIGGPDEALETAYRDAYFAGMVHFASTGNGGADQIGDFGIGYPSSAPYVNSVGSMTITGARATYSNFGTGLDFTAPGNSLPTVDRTGTTGYSTTDYTMGFSGTSAACPVAAGVAALYMASHPNLGPLACELAMQSSARDLGAAGYDTDWGFGEVQAHGALRKSIPNNDTCSGARTISGFSGTATQDLNNWFGDNYAMASREEPVNACTNNVGHTVWYRYTASTSGMLNLDTFGSNCDTVLSAFDGCGQYLASSDAFLFAPASLGCNDDADGTYQSRISGINLIQGQAVLIKAGVYGGPSSTSSNLHLNWNFVPGSPPNNRCSTATTIVNNTYNIFGLDTRNTTNTNGCTSETPAPCAASGKALWWAFTPLTDGYLNVSTFGSNYDTVISVQAGCGRQIPTGINGQLTCFQAEVLACNDDFNGALQSTLTNVLLRANITYKIRVAGFTSAITQISASGDLTLNMSFVPTVLTTPANDECSNAWAIDLSTPYTISGHDTQGATIPGGCGDPVATTTLIDTSRSVWWTFTPPSDGTISLDTFGSNYDTVLSIYDGSTGCPADNGAGCEYPTLVAWNDDSFEPGFSNQARIVDHPVTAGTPYYVRLSAYGASNLGGLASLNVTYTATGPVVPVNDACDAAIEIPSNSLSYSGAGVNTTLATAADICSDFQTMAEVTLPEKTIWYRWTAPANGTVNISTASSDYDTVLAFMAVSNGCGTYDAETEICTESPIEVASSDDIGEVLQAELQSVEVVGATTYLIRISNKAGEAGGTAVLDFSFTEIAPPVCLPDLGQQGGIPGADGTLDNNDFVVFIDLFFNLDPLADLGQQGGVPGADGAWDNNDFVVFIDLFFTGCP